MVSSGGGAQLALHRGVAAPIAASTLRAVFVPGAVLCTFFDSIS